MAQADFVASRLRATVPGIDVELVGITSLGDRDKSPSLAEAGGKNSFVGALEDALDDGRADLAVHSMKDVAVRVPERFAVHTFGPRADVRDALVVDGSAADLTVLPKGARVGTASARRRALLLALRRDLEIVPVRGNVDTRLKRLEEDDYAALLLACAGLDRLGYGERIGQRIDPDVLVPAPGQGALAVERLAGRDDLDALLRTGVVADVENCVAAGTAGDAALSAPTARCRSAPTACARRRPSASDGGSRRTQTARRRCAWSVVGDEPRALGDDAAKRLSVLGVGELLGH